MILFTRPNTFLIPFGYSYSTSSEPTFMVNGSAMTVAEVLAVKALDRSIAHWAVLVDWDLQRQSPYVIVDPYDPEGLLYLKKSEYLSQMKVCASNDITLIVIARPGSKQPVSSSQNSPPRKEVPFDSKEFFAERSNRLTWRNFLDLRRFVSRNVELDDGMVTATSLTMLRTVLLWARELLHYSAVTAPERRLEGFTPFARALAALVTHNGLLHTTQRMKIALFCVYSYIGGNPLSSTDALGLRLRLSNGLPILIPTPYRREIRKGNLRWIRIWVSLLNMGRALKVKTPDPETAYETIRKPAPHLDGTQLFIRWQYFCKEVFPGLLATQAEGGTLPMFKYKSNIGLIIRSAGTNLRSSSSIQSMILDAKAWTLCPSNYPLMWFKHHGDKAMEFLMNKIAEEPHWGAKWLDPMTGEDQSDLSFITEEAWRVPDAKAQKARLQKARKMASASGALIGHMFDAYKKAWEVGPAYILDEAGNRAGSYDRFNTGRLFNFAAPGGKLRTVAICDYWTQCAVKGVHDHLFKLLRIIHRNDGTFDQQGTVDRYWARNLKPHWSFDLKAATDSIPLSLYIECLTPFLREEKETYEDARKRAELWAKLMTDRDFALPSPKKGELGHTGLIQYRTIRYGTGQPMGAYSSWASMALVHHALVQFSSWLSDNQFDVSAMADFSLPGLPQEGLTTRESRAFFSTYLVLGDDVDISEKATVADNYQLVCKAFGIKIGLHKSLKSNNNFFEFANQRFCENGNISPLSFMEEVQSSTSWNKRVEFARRIASRFGLNVGESMLVRLTVTARQWQSLVPELSGTRPLLFLRLLKFILLNPLKDLWIKPDGSRSDISIDAIRAWLANLKEVVASHASPDSLRILEAELRTAVSDLVKTSLKQTLESIPESTVYYGYDQEVTNFLTSIGEGYRSNAYKPDPSWRYVLPKAKWSYTYFQMALNWHNERLRKDLRQFEMNNWKILMQRPALVLDPTAMRKRIPDQFYSPPLEVWVRLWIELGNFPKPIRRSQDFQVDYLRMADPSQREINDHAEALLKVIIPKVAEVLGLEVASVPYYPLLGARGTKGWARVVKRSLSKFTGVEKLLASCRLLSSNPDFNREITWQHYLYGSPKSKR